MICQFKRLIYPKTVTAGDASYMIALYRPCEKVMDAAGNVVSEIKAVGYCLPTADNLRYDSATGLRFCGIMVLYEQ